MICGNGLKVSWSIWKCRRCDLFQFLWHILFQYQTSCELPCSFFCTYDWYNILNMNPMVCTTLCTTLCSSSGCSDLPQHMSLFFSRRSASRAESRPPLIRIIDISKLPLSPFRVLGIRRLRSGVPVSGIQGAVRSLRRKRFPAEEKPSCQAWGRAATHDSAWELAVQWDKRLFFDHLLDWVDAQDLDVLLGAVQFVKGFRPK